MPSLGRPDGQGADRVVRLVVRDEEHRDPKGLHDLLDQPQLRPEVLRRLPAPGLVVRVHREPSGRLADVERHRDQVGALLAEELDQHRGEAVDGVRDLPGGGGQGARQGEERAVREGVAVEDEQPARLGRCVGGGGRHGAIVPVASGAPSPSPRRQDRSPRFRPSPRLAVGGELVLGWPIAAPAPSLDPNTRLR